MGHWGGHTEKRNAILPICERGSGRACTSTSLWYPRADGGKAWQADEQMEGEKSLHGAAVRSARVSEWCQCICFGNTTHVSQLVTTGVLNLQWIVMSRISRAPRRRLSRCVVGPLSRWDGRRDVVVTTYR